MDRTQVCGTCNPGSTPGGSTIRKSPLRVFSNGAPKQGAFTPCGQESKAVAMFTSEAGSQTLSRFGVKRTNILSDL